MVLVDGDYCPDADQVCLKWLDPPPYQNLRCGEYAKPAKCKGPRQHRRFCVDRERVRRDRRGTEAKDALPVVNKSWTEAKSICEARGARLCKESEWEFACEGPDMNPYPYGFKRDSSLCNHDRTDLGGAEDKLTDHRAPLSAFPACISPFGAHDMIGNVDEWVEREGSGRPASLVAARWLVAARPQPLSRRHARITKRPTPPSRSASAAAPTRPELGTQPKSFAARGRGTSVGDAVRLRHASELARGPRIARQLFGADQRSILLEHRQELVPHAFDEERIRVDAQRDGAEILGGLRHEHRAGARRSPRSPS